MRDRPTITLRTSSSVLKAPVVWSGMRALSVRTLPAPWTTLRWARAPATFTGSTAYWLIRSRVLVTQICSFCRP